MIDFDYDDYICPVCGDILVHWGAGSYYEIGTFGCDSCGNTFNEEILEK